jgi:hypothetical protein
MSVTDQQEVVLKNKRHSSGQQAAREILILCTTTRISPEKKERLSKLLAKTVDWEYLQLLVEFHNIAPLVYHNIMVNNLSDRVNESCLEHFQANYNEALYRNIVLSNELANLISGLKKHDIPVIALKGIALAEMLYDNIVLRNMLDIDILVQPDNLSRTDALLKEMGYRQPMSSGRMAHPFHGAPYFKLEGARYFVELHWTLEDEKLISIPVEKIWERSQTLRLQSGETRVLSLENTLIFSAIRLYKEANWLKVLIDIAELTKKYEGTLDWDYIIDDAHSWRIETILYYSLGMAKDILEAPVPLAVLEKLKPKAWRRWIIEFFSCHETFLMPTKRLQLREETINVVFSLMMSGFRQARLVHEKYRGKEKRGAWLRTTTWIIVVSISALWRNMTRMVSGRIWPVG